MNTLLRVGRILKVAYPDTIESLRNCFARWSYSLDNFNEKMVKDGKLDPGFEADLKARLPFLEELYAEELAALSPSPPPAQLPAPETVQ